MKVGSSRMRSGACWYPRTSSGGSCRAWRKRHQPDGGQPQVLLRIRRASDALEALHTGPTPFAGPVAPPTQSEQRRRGPPLNPDPGCGTASRPPTRSCKIQFSAPARSTWSPKSSQTGQVHGAVNFSSMNSSSAFSKPRHATPTALRAATSSGRHGSRALKPGASTRPYVLVKSTATRRPRPVN